MDEKVSIPFITDTVVIDGTYYPEDSFVSQPLNGFQGKMQAYSKEMIDRTPSFIDELV